VDCILTVGSDIAVAVIVYNDRLIVVNFIFIVLRVDTAKEIS